MFFNTITPINKYLIFVICKYTMLEWSPKAAWHLKTRLKLSSFEQYVFVFLFD